MGVLWATNPNDGKGRTMDTKERLKHASEVLGWLAEGKTIQWKHAVRPDEWEDFRTPDTRRIVENILGGTYIYRIKPEPVEFVAEVRVIPSWRESVVMLDALRFPEGTKVKVTLLES